MVFNALSIAMFGMAEKEIVAEFDFIHLYAAHKPVRLWAGNMLKGDIVILSVHDVACINKDEKQAFYCQYAF